MKDWQDLYNDNGKEETNNVESTCEIQINNYVVYECTGIVELYNDIPCSADITKMTRQVFNYDGKGELLDELELDYEEFPHYIMSAAEKKMVQNYE